MPNHRCDESTIDYSSVTVGNLRCRTCGRRWHLVPGRGWEMEPREPMPR